MSADTLAGAVVRLRGKPAHATPALLAPTFDADIAAVLAEWSAKDGRHPFRRMDPVFAAREIAAERFAIANGWRISEKSFPLYHLGVESERAELKHAEARGAPGLLDHYEYLRRLSQPIGIITHLYGALNLALVPSSVVVDALPESWYIPGATSAYLLRPRATP